jgi:hypothetical protein
MNRKDNYKKIGKFLKELTPIEYRYMELTMQMVSGFNHIIETYKLSKEDFCKKMEVKPAKYEDYVKGNYNYSIHDMVQLQMVHADLEHERLRARDIIKVETEKQE